MPLPSYMAEGWRRAGPGLCRCPDCHETVTTNALGRASHARACTAERAAKRAADRVERMRRQTPTARVDDVFADRRCAGCTPAPIEAVPL